MFFLKQQKAFIAASIFTVSHLTKAAQLVTNSSLPTNLTANCASALLHDVNCSPVVTAFRIGSYYPQSTLNRTCTAQCATALATYQSTIVSACRDQTWLGYEDNVMPLDVIPDMLRYLYNLTCLTDSGRYCNNVAAEAALLLDPASMIPFTFKAFSAAPVYSDSLARDLVQNTT